MRFPSKFDDYKALRDSGKTPDEIIESGFCSRSTALRHEKTLGGPVEISDPPDGIRIEGFDAKGGKGKRGRTTSGRTKNAPITEETAGMILQGISEIVAFMANEQELKLDDEETEILERPFTESLALLPTDLAKGINKYAAPGVFVSQFIAIYTRKMKRIAEARAGLIQRNVTPGTTPQRPPQPAAPPQSQYERTNAEAIRVAAAAVAAGAATNGRSAGAAPVQSTGTLEGDELERKTEFET